MINPGASNSNYNFEESLNLNSVFDIRRDIPSSHHSQSDSPDLDFDQLGLDVYLKENGNVSSQEVLNGLPTLYSNESNLSEIVNTFQEIGVNSPELFPEDIKPQITLTYPMIPKWSDVKDLYFQMKRRRSSVTPDMSPLQSNHDFQLHLPPAKKNSKFYYSNEKQLFIKGDSQFHFTVSYTSTDDTVKFIRLMPVIPSNISKPVIRCENHASKDSISSVEKKYNVIQSDYPEVIYDGIKEGKSADERLSIVFPLPCSNSNGVGENKEETIPIMFVCQTSCIGRDDIEVICTLENSTEVLARTTMQVKICSCPKRDVQKRNEESGIPSRNGRKRPLQTSSRIGEGKRIKTEVLSQAPPQNGEESYELNMSITTTNCEYALQYRKLMDVFLCSLVTCEKRTNPVRFNDLQYFQSKLEANRAVLQRLEKKIIEMETPQKSAA